MWRTSWLSRECLCLPAFLACAFAYGVAHWFGWPSSLAIGALGVLASGALFVCTAMIYACLRFLQEWATPLTHGQLRAARLRVRIHACHRVRRVARAVADGGACRLRLRADARGLREPRRFARAQCAPASEVDGAERDRHQEARTSCRNRAASRPVRSTCASSSTDKRRARLRRVKWTFLVGAFGVPFVLMVLGVSASSVGLSIGLVLRGLRDAIRGTRRGTLVLLRRGAASAEPVLRAFLVKV